MASNAYQFVTRWRIAATPEEITDVLADAVGLARWWPSVYLSVSVDAPGDPGTGLGKVVSLWTKGWLPYTLRWSFRVTESKTPTGFALEATGDFVGRGVWTLQAVHAPDAPGGPETLVTYDWRIAAEKGILRRLSFVMKPVFGANHRWAMARGEESLRIEIARRHALSSGDVAILAAIPAPPGPTFPHNLALFRRRAR
ncbi:MAG TPA: SRPBCC family protein [Candidatus Limnocylindrales bacterium]|nr:SRPBCC family protein [Candidatus Limnocylindrales bacterium]